jgi:hypothetical protein
MSGDTSITKSIEGKVASVLNERELAINIGVEQGVKEGMKFKVLAEKPTEILDPETGEILGELDREKVRVRVLEVREKFSVCRTYKKRYASGGPFYNMFAVGDLVAGPRVVVETLKAEDSSLPPPLSEEESYVKKGDRVIQLLKDDDD